MRIWGPGLVVFVVLASAGSAGAATRYADPASGSAAPCTAAAPCSLPLAVSGAAAGDVVIPDPGTYELAEALVVSQPGVSILGDPTRPMPRVVLRNGYKTSAIDLGYAGDAVSGLEVVGEGGLTGALFCADGARVERVKAYSRGWPTVEMRGACDISDSLVVNSAEGTGINAVWGPAGSAIGTIRDSTVIAEGAYGDAIDSQSYETATYTLGISNTIASGTTSDLGAYDGGTGQMTIDVSHSSFESGEASGRALIESEAGNQVTPPIFVDAANRNFAEAAGSPTIDAGAILPQFTTPALDLAGNPRLLGGGIDIGAYEFVPPTPPSATGGGPAGSGGSTPASPAPPPPAPPVTLGGLKLSPSSFRVAGGKGKGKGATGTKISYTLTGAAQVSFGVARRTSGRRAGKACVKASRGNATKPKCSRWTPLAGSFGASGAAGADTLRFAGVLAGRPLVPGRYRLTAKVGSSTTTAGFTVLN